MPRVYDDDNEWIRSGSDESRSARFTRGGAFFRPCLLGRNCGLSNGTSFVVPSLPRRLFFRDLTFLIVVGGSWRTWLTYGS